MSASSVCSGILPVGRVASYVELYAMASRVHAQILQTGVTDALLERYQVTDEHLDLSPYEFFSCTLPSKGLA